MQTQKVSHKMLFIFTALSSIIYLSWRIFYTIPIGFGTVAVVSGIILLVVEIIGMIESAVHFYNMAYLEIPLKPKVGETVWPHIDVFIATYNEPVELLYKTVNGCLNMDYPNKQWVHIYLCDDGGREEVKQLAGKMGIHYITRTDRSHAKAGNLNHAMNYTDSPLIVTFDADMIPMHDFLTTCVPYFLQEEKIGFIQLPQSFYNPDLFQYNLFSEGRIPNEQDYFYQDIQTAKNRTNSVIYGGSNTVLARAALEEVGGFYTKVITEDFATGMLIQSKGYRCYAINEIHASGLSPDDLESLIKQRARWARGCIQTSRKLNILFKRGLRLGQKLNYIISISYWYSGLKQLVYVASPILFSVFGVMVVKCNVIGILIFWLPMYLLTNTALKVLSNNIRTKKWTNIYETILFPALLPGVLLETFCISQKKFAVTKKDGSADDSRYQTMLAIPHTIGVVFTSIGILNSVRLLFVTGSPSYMIVIFWLIGNLFTLIMALFFIAGRKRNRKAERFRIETDCSIWLKNKEVKARTYDISEGGISVVMDFPEYITEDNLKNIQIRTERYRAVCKAKLIQVQQKDKEWRYAFSIVSIEESQYNQLLHIMHDRIPPLPHVLSENSIYTDLFQNIKTRKQKLVTYQRKLPRILLNKQVEMLDENGHLDKVTLVSFDYAYLLVTKSKANRLNIEEKGYSLYLERVARLEETLENNLEARGVLYRIINGEELASNPIFRVKLYEWMEECQQNIKQMAEKKAQYMKQEKSKEEYNEMSFLE